MNDYSELREMAKAAKAAHPGNPWYYQEKSDAYTHIVRVDNPALNNSMIVAHLSQRTDGVSEAVARYFAATNPDVIMAMLAELDALRANAEPVEGLVAKFGDQERAYYRLNDHNNECERQLDEASALLDEIARGGQVHRECTDKGSPSGKRIAALSASISQFQPEAYKAASDEAEEEAETAEHKDWRMNPCKQGHRDVGAAGGVAHCYQCDEQIIAVSTQEAFEKWNATHPAEHPVVVAS